jgi:diguanylate cyclase (GGDEF)-like protein
MIDNATLMIAIAFSSAALMVTLLICWLNARRDSYLISWAGGMGFVVMALAMLSLRGHHYDRLTQIGSFSLLLTGMALIYLGGCQFRSGATPWLRATVLWVMSLLATNVPFVIGLSGLGTIMLNLFSGAFMILTAHQYWAGRAEARLPLTSNAMLYGMTGLSFMTCAVVLIVEGEMVLTAAPTNWAEQINSIMAIIGLTGIGALSLTLNQLRATRRHRQDALTDSLTGLLNRRGLFDSFGQSEPSPGTAVLMFDIDHFKQVNDQQGHAAGDAVIQQFSIIARLGMRQGDTVARVGGEEFCAVLPGVPLDRAKAIAERIRVEFQSTPAQIGSQVIPATVSVGVATTGKNESFSSVLSRADAALYKAKANGRNRVTDTPRAIA